MSSSPESDDRPGFNVPRTLVQGLGFLLGIWLAVELLQPLGARDKHPVADLPDVAAPPTRSSR